MAKQTTKTVNGNIETFNNYYTRRTVGKTYNVLATDFFAAKYAVNTATGETYTLTPAMKLVYMHMRNAYCVQIEKGNDYFEGWTSICVSSGLSEKAYTKFKATLINLGLVVEGATKGRAKVLVVRDSATLTDIEFTNDDKVKLKAEQAEKRELYKAEQAASTPATPKEDIDYSNPNNWDLAPDPEPNPFDPVVTPEPDPFDDWDDDMIPF